MFINYLSGVFNGGNEGKASSIQLPQLGSMSMPKEILQQYTTSQTALMININKVGTIESPISERVFKTAYENNMYYGEMIFIDERECGYNLSQRKPLTGSSFSKFIKCSPYADSEVDSEIITVENQTDYNQLGENVDFFLIRMVYFDMTMRLIRLLRIHVDSQVEIRVILKTIQD